jgi:DNA (cytosine-5)-methyltransferase 1
MATRLISSATSPSKNLDYRSSLREPELSVAARAVGRVAPQRARAVAESQLPLQLQEGHRPSKAKATQVGQIHTVVGLFAGIGGLEHGLHQAGHETALVCEKDPAAIAVLQSRFSTVPLHDDVTTLRSLPRSTSLLVAGFPCQDLSQAGRTNGIAGAKSALVGEVFRLAEKHKVPWILLENVPFMLQLNRGEAMNVITTTLESLGYSWAYRVVDTRAFGLPQRRRRVYLVAALRGDPRTILFADEAGEREMRELSASGLARGFYWTEGNRGLGWAIDAIPTLKGGSAVGIPSAPAMLLSSGEIATPEIRDAERLQGFPADWTKPAEAVAKRGIRWRLVGNAVSVPAAVWVGRRFRKPGNPIAFATTDLTRKDAWPTAAWNVGAGRKRVLASEWPVCRRYASLEAFLKFPTTPLSEKATAGFLRRAEKANLRFEPGFLDAVRSHLSIARSNSDNLPKKRKLVRQQSRGR